MGSTDYRSEETLEVTQSLIIVVKIPGSSSLGTYLFRMISSYRKLENVTDAKNYLSDSNSYS